MRKAQLDEFVRGLVLDTWKGSNIDVANSVTVNDDEFDAMATKLQLVAGDDPEAMRKVWNETVDRFTDRDLDFIVDRAERPAIFVMSKFD